jgi:hypothetical protein
MSTVQVGGKRLRYDVGPDHRSQATITAVNIGMGDRLGNTAAAEPVNGKSTGFSYRSIDPSKLDVDGPLSNEQTNNRQNKSIHYQK